jgi:transcriptional regulator with XRE-family HTH domain
MTRPPKERRGDSDEVAARIVQARRQLGMSQNDLAKRLGMSRSAVALWEANRSIPSGRRVAEVAEVLGLPVEALIPSPRPRASAPRGESDLLRDLSVLAKGGDFTLWHYRSGTKYLSVATAANYFAEAADLLRVGDMLMISASDGATMRVVVRSELGAVTLAPLA